MDAKITEYKGILYRSLTEAKWAAIFDFLEIQFEYEAKMFKLASGSYLPDFWLPNQQLWIEIKGDIPTQDERQKAIELSLETKCEVYILAGSPFTDIFPDNFSSGSVTEICGFGVYKVNSIFTECERFTLGSCNNTLLEILRLIGKHTPLDAYRDATGHLAAATNRANQTFSSASTMREVVAELKQEMFGWMRLNK